MLCLHFFVLAALLRLDSKSPSLRCDSKLAAASLGMSVLLARRKSCAHMPDLGKGLKSHPGNNGSDEKGPKNTYLRDHYSATIIPNNPKATNLKWLKHAIPDLPYPSSRDTIAKKKLTPRHALFPDIDFNLQPM